MCLHFALPRFQRFGECDSLRVLRLGLLLVIRLQRVLTGFGGGVTSFRALERRLEACKLELGSAALCIQGVVLGAQITEGRLALRCS